ncbi:MAG: SGNH/GDSL hydrolase family protein [Blautia sp.]|nr:SGNH/GDSL hydrolase family protein [Lachnoclostridium sp.]MCM1211351.1 SGNH/GDSL hydrolase family protein [Blautia sp.]
MKVELDDKNLHVGGLTMHQVDITRLQNCMQKAAKGEELTIGFLGGSITQGSLASKPQNTYAYWVFHWWEKTFPGARFHYVNGGIGGTTSHYGVARVVTDVLMYQPDFVVVDFSVNDEANDFFQETYEGVVRKILGWQSAPALLLLHNVYYDTGINAQEYHNAISAWYQVPYVSVKDTIYQDMKKGIYAREELTLDGLHPNDKGHELVAGEIIKYLESVRTQETRASEASDKTITAAGLCVEASAKAAASILPAPMTKNAYENAKRLTIREISPRLAGFHADTEEKTGHLDHFKNGWIGKAAGDAITFTLEASCIAVQYRKTIHKPAMCAELILDGDRSHKIMLDSNFNEDWGDCLYLEPILHHGERVEHTVEIVIPKEEDSKKTPFYLMALIIA